MRNEILAELPALGPNRPGGRHRRGRARWRGRRHVLGRGARRHHPMLRSFLWGPT